MTAEQRAAHYEALWRLYRHVDRIWEAPKQANGPHPAELGGYGPVAGLRDMLDRLFGHLEEVRSAAGEQPEDYRAQMVVELVD
ncbi:hypothetical protein [Micromonospora sp. 4G55]|uniref:hypothetical protein n=1 Tax=Micromonospora sp. 4G55 TaxID=2806102 RepID=UPI001A414D62|nr:hypothetical protein [Micromonospora sp. 4G55]MBM0255901.1 hypothetical protein [Micromonospora sp. 4G55]